MIVRKATESGLISSKLFQGIHDAVVTATLIFRFYELSALKNYLFTKPKPNALSNKSLVARYVTHVMFC